MQEMSTKEPCEVALIGERHVRIEISDFVMRTFVHEEVCMEQVEKRMRLLGYIKWAGFLLGLVMYAATVHAFGETWAVVLGTAAACAFFFLCEDGKRGVLCEHIAEELQETVERVGDLDCIFEIKSMKLGLIIRVYFIKAGDEAPRCGAEIVRTITRSWYQSQVWMTQFVDLADEDELPEAAEALNEELLESLKAFRDRNRRK